MYSKIPFLKTVQILYNYVTYTEQSKILYIQNDLSEFIKHESFIYEIYVSLDGAGFVVGGGLLLLVSLELVWLLLVLL